MMHSEMLALSRFSTLTCTMVAGVAVSKKTSMMVLSTAKEAKMWVKLVWEVCCIASVGYAVTAGAADAAQHQHAPYSLSTITTYTSCVERKVK